MPTVTRTLAYTESVAHIHAENKNCDLVVSAERDILNSFE
jgi:hypothetical protein